MSQVSDYTNYTNATQRLQDSYDTERTETRANHEKEVKDLKEGNVNELQAAKKEYNQRLEAERAQARDEVKKLKEEMYDHNGKSYARDFKEQQEARNTLNRFHDDVQKQADRRVSRAEDRTDEQAAHQQEVENNKVEAALAAQNHSHMQQVNALEGELSEYRGADRNVEKDRAQARYQSIAENEKTYLDDKRRIIDGYDHEIGSMKEHQDQINQHFSRELTDAAVDSRQLAQTQIRNQKADFQKLHQAEVTQKYNLEDTYKVALANSRNHEEHASDHLISKNNKDRVLLAASKDQTYQNYIAEKDTRDKIEIDSRDAEIQDLRTTDDPMKVSPFVIKKVSDESDERNYKSLTEAQSVFDKNLDAEKTRDQVDRRALSDQFNAKVTGIHRDSRKEFDTQNRQFRDSYQDLQDMHQSQVASLTEQKRGMTEKLFEKNSLDLAAAGEEKRDALTEQKETLGYEKAAALDEAQQSRRNQDREWFMKMNDLKRNFEAQMAEVRDNHEKETGQMRLEYDKKLRDQDRSSKRTIDSQARSFEHQITQQALAFKEKERFLTEHYEEELDTMKRTNAHIIQKKS